MSHIGMTINRHILEQQQHYPQATGELSGLLTQIALAAKVISRQVNQASLIDILGATGERNVHGETVMKLDTFAHQAMVEALTYSGHVCALASEEAVEPIFLPADGLQGPYVVLFDPLDGSSNIDTGITIGTIFSVYRKQSAGKTATLADLLQRGDRQVAAGYIVYGSYTMLVYTTGRGVHGYTLAPTVGEFLLTHADITIPPRGTTYSANGGNYAYWQPEVQRYMDYLVEEAPADQRPYSHRYVGTLVADFHRTVLHGGIFFYPADIKDPRTPSGKLRLLYEAMPLAFIACAAGGRASTGVQDILTLEPTQLHERVPLFIGSRDDVTTAEAFCRGER